jgi:hypothetical protein
MTWQERRWGYGGGGGGLGTPNSNKGKGNNSGGGGGKGRGRGRGGGGGGGGGPLSWGTEVVTYDFTVTPLATLPIIDISAYDKVQILGEGLSAGSGGVDWRFTKSGTPVSTAGYYNHVRQRSTGQDTLTHDAEGTIITGSGNEQAFSFNVEHHNSATIPTLVVNRTVSSTIIAEDHQMISDVIEVVDGIEIYRADTNNLTLGTITVIGYNYPSYAETLVASFDFGTTPANEMITDALASYDEVRVVGLDITCSQLLQMRLRNSGTDISSAAYYERIGIGNTVYNLSADTGYPIVAVPTAGAFSQNIRYHNSTDRSTEFMGRSNAAATVGAHELNVSNTIETVAGMRVFSAGGANITAGKAWIIGINRGETVTLLSSTDFASTPVASVTVDGLDLYHEIELSAFQVTHANQVKWRWREAGVDIDTANYYQRLYIGTIDGYDLNDTGFFFGSTGGTNRYVTQRIEGHLSATRITYSSKHNGESSGSAQMEGYFANALGAHDGITVADTTPANMTAGALKIFGIKYE